MPLTVAPHRVIVPTPSTGRAVAVRRREIRNAFLKENVRIVAEFG